MNKHGKFNCGQLNEIYILLYLSFYFSMEILKIHAAGIAKHGEIDHEAIVKLSDNFNGADLRNVCTEAGLFAIRLVQKWILGKGSYNILNHISCLIIELNGNT